MAAVGVVAGADADAGAEGVDGPATVGTISIADMVGGCVERTIRRRRGRRRRRRSRSKAQVVEISGGRTSGNAFR